MHFLKCWIPLYYSNALKKKLMYISVFKRASDLWTPTERYLLFGVMFGRMKKINSSCLKDQVREKFVLAHFVRGCVQWGNVQRAEFGGKNVWSNFYERHRNLGKVPRQCISIPCSIRKFPLPLIFS